MPPGLSRRPPTNCTQHRPKGSKTKQAAKAACAHQAKPAHPAWRRSHPRQAELLPTVWLAAVEGQRRAGYLVAERLLSEGARGEEGQEQGAGEHPEGSHPVADRAREGGGEGERVRCR